MTHGMKLFQNCLTQLTVEFIKYCKEQGVELIGRPQFIIRRNISINPIWKLIMSYSKVMVFKATRETVDYVNYLKEDISRHLFLDSSKIGVYYQRMFFQRIIRKEERRRERK